MVFTTEALYIVTTAKKGTNLGTSGFLGNHADSLVTKAKHLEPLKGGKVPVEILVRNPKDAEQNNRHFEKCLDLIKGAGVCQTEICCDRA